jgi:hypothetical protein
MAEEPGLRLSHPIPFSNLIDRNREAGSSTWVPSGGGMPVYELDRAGSAHNVLVHDPGVKQGLMQI